MNSLNIIVDTLLHALQVTSDSGACCLGMCSARLPLCWVLPYFELWTLFKLPYLCFRYLLTVWTWNLKLWTWYLLILWLVSITFVINLIIQYNWWLDPGQSRPRSGCYPQVEFGGVTYCPKRQKTVVVYDSLSRKVLNYVQTSMPRSYKDHGL